MKCLYLLIILILRTHSIKQVEQAIKFDKVEIKTNARHQSQQQIDLFRNARFTRFYQLTNKQNDELEQFQNSFKDDQEVEQMKQMQNIQSDFIKELRIPVTLNIVHRQIFVSFQLIEQLYQQIQNQQNLYDFAIKLQHLSQLVKTFKTDLYQNIKTNQQIVFSLVESTLQLRQILQKMDNADLQLQKLNNNVVGLDKSQKQIEILENIHSLQNNKVFSQNIDYAALKLYVNNYCGLTSVYNRLSHQINIKIDDPSSVQIQKLIQSPLYCFYRPDEESYHNIVQQQNWILYRQYKLFMDLNQDYKESIDYFTQNNQVSDELSALQSQLVKNEIVGQIEAEIDMFLNVQEKEVDQGVNVNQAISDEEEEYIKANKIYDQSQLQKEQKVQQKQVQVQQKQNDQKQVQKQNENKNMQLINVQSPALQILQKLKQKQLEALRQIQQQNGKIVVTKQNSQMIQKMKEQSIQLQKMMDQDEQRKK